MIWAQTRYFGVTLETLQHYLAYSISKTLNYLTSFYQKMQTSKTHLQFDKKCQRFNIWLRRYHGRTFEHRGTDICILGSSIK